MYGILIEIDSQKKSTIFLASKNRNRNITNKNNPQIIIIIIIK